MRTDPRAYWQWVARTAGWRKKDTTTSGAQPIKHPNMEELITEEHRIRGAWEVHCGRLAADETENSTSAARWQAWYPRPERKHLVCLDADISREEMYASLNKIKRNKTAGSDGIPVDFLKLALAKVLVPREEGDGEAEDPPGVGMDLSSAPSTRRTREQMVLKDTAFSDVVLGILGLIWQGQIVPDVWQDSTLVSIPKKGEMTDMNNYRGISLMGTVRKLLMVILSERLNNVFEHEQLFTKAQAGFRRKEECVTQVACLYENAKSRQICGKRTFLLFIDLQKSS